MLSFARAKWQVLGRGAAATCLCGTSPARGKALGPHERLVSCSAFRRAAGVEFGEPACIQRFVAGARAVSCPQVPGQRDEESQRVPSRPADAIGAETSSSTKTQPCQGGLRIIDGGS